ncbi:glycosyltransferase domain-containing protein [Paenibacillus alvei]|uniref:glycosyltransferase domain-containing protein n=1 Tax=Paenibacillus alvei TaxID=44250 RepID=UPI0013DD1890|nr:DUF616 domain-containing protein [Paenibacillus alvei]
MVRESLREHPIAIFKHPFRDCIYKEAEEVARLKFDYAPVIEQQLEAYRKADYPQDNGLVASGLMFCSHQDPKVIQLMQQWWDEIEALSKRDQLSFYYVFWKNQEQYAVIEDDIFKHPCFQYRHHVLR